MSSGEGVKEGSLQHPVSFCVFQLIYNNNLPKKERKKKGKGTMRIKNKSLFSV